jgi:hypothetical protein
VVMLQSCGGEVAQFPAGVSSSRLVSVPRSREWQGHCAGLSTAGISVVRPAAGVTQVSTAQTHGLHGTVLPDAPHRLELGATKVHPQDQGSRLQR